MSTVSSSHSYNLPITMLGTSRGDVTQSAVPWLQLLAPSENGASLVPASSGALLAHAVKAVGSDGAQWAVEVGNDVAIRVAHEIPGHVAGGGFDVLRMGTESAVLRLLIMFTQGYLDEAVTSESLGGVPDFVRRRVTLDEFLRGIQLGHSVIAAAFLAECARLGAPEQRHEQMRTLSQSMFAFFDDFSTDMGAYFREEEARWAQSEAASRLALVEDVLAGTQHDAEAISRRLRFDPSATHVAIIVWSSGRILDADQTALHDAACEIVRGAGCEQKLVLSVGSGVVWAWATPRGSVDAFTERLVAAILPAQTHATTGQPGRGLPGFRHSHHDARAAFELRSRASSSAGVTPYRDVDLLTLLLADRERATRFARAELGQLSADDSATADLRRTVAAYLDEGGSPNAAGRKLQVSRNTVTYRVHRAEELLGRPISERRQQLRSALLIFDDGGSS